MSTPRAPSPVTARRRADSTSIRPEWATGALVAGSGAATLLWLARGARWEGTANLWLLGLALALHATMWLAPATRPRWTVRRSLGVVAVLLAAAAVLPLHHSRDLYLYDAYGRAVVEHRVSPYTTTPAELGDPAARLVAEQWHDQTSMYGPAFVAVAAAVAQLGGTSELQIRLAWQAITAAAALGALALVGRRTRDPAAVLALGCSPVLLAAVNDAHNDVLVGLGLLAVVLLLDDRRYAWAGAVASLVVAVKVPAAVPVAAVAAWAWWRRGWQPLLRFAAPLVAAVTTAYLAVGGRDALVPLRESAGDDSRFAIWQPLRDARVERLLAEGVPWRVALDTVRAQMSSMALVLLAATLLVVLWRYRRAGHPGEVAAVAGVALMAASTYVMPWYPAMVLPVAALAWRSRASLLVQAQAAFLLFAYALGPGRDPTTWLGAVLEERAVWVNVAVLVALCIWARPSLRESGRADILPTRRRPAVVASGG